MPTLSRRAFVGASVVVVAAGAGVVAEFVRHPRRTSSVQARRASASASEAAVAKSRAPLLHDALTREHALLAQLDAAARTTPALHPFTDVLRADHRAHATAISALMAAVGASPSPSPSPSRSRSPNESPSAASSTSTTADLLRWEKSSAAEIATDAAAVTGGAEAAVLASIYACEQTHVAWLS